MRVGCLFSILINAYGKQAKIAPASKAAMVSNRVTNIKSAFQVSIKNRTNEWALNFLMNSTEAEWDSDEIPSVNCGAGQRGGLLYYMYIPDDYY